MNLLFNITLIVQKGKEEKIRRLLLENMPHIVNRYESCYRFNICEILETENPETISLPVMLWLKCELNEIPETDSYLESVWNIFSQEISNNEEVLMFPTLMKVLT